MKNNSQKGFIVPVLLGIIAILIIGGGVYLYKTKKVDAPVVVNGDEKVDVENENLNKIEKNYQKESSVLPSKIVKSAMFGPIEFYHPEALVEKAYDEQFGIPVISLSHSFPYKHVNSCDLKDGLSIDTATDFSAQFKLYNTNLIDSIKKDNPNGYTDMIKNGIVSIQPGFVDKYKLGTVDGYKISIGAEGCGYSTYYFPISSNETLVVKRDIYLQTLQMGREKLVNIPGFISQTKEDQIFKDILTSIKGLGQKETMVVKVYFGDTIDAQSCNTPSYVERTIPKTTAVARASIEELLKGPTEAEKLKDFWTGLRSGISIKSLTINNGVASLDLSTPQASSLNDPNKGACGAVISIKQIENTLKQFSTIKSVLITINGGKQDSINP